MNLKATASKLYHYLKQRIIYFLGGVIVKIKGLDKESIDILNSLKGIYEGKRCFILGNGPSLRADDLNSLKNEITFASNRIYRIFGQTDWRPTYFVMFDENVAKSSGVVEGVNGINCIKFVRKQGFFYYKNITGKVCYLHSWYSRRYLDNPAFSEELEKGVYSIATVTYTMIQLARWMGFNEIYLLGMDNRYAYSILRDGTIVKNEGVISYFSANNEEIPDRSTASATWECDVAYEYAEKYSRSHNFRIFNATRGGFLEAFERANLDDILKKDE